MSGGSMGAKTDNPYCSICGKIHKGLDEAETGFCEVDRPTPRYFISIVERGDPSATGYITHINGEPIPREED